MKCQVGLRSVEGCTRGGEVTTGDEASVVISVVFAVIVPFGNVVWALLGAVQMPADSTRFGWVTVRTAVDGAAGALETLVYLSRFLLPVFDLAVVR